MRSDLWLRVFGSTFLGGTAVGEVVLHLTAWRPYASLGADVSSAGC